MEIQQKIDQFNKNVQEGISNPGSTQTKDLIQKVKEEILSQCKR
jgi:hypothetical protein